MLLPYFLLLALPNLSLCQFDWKVEQPVSYVIYNGKYYANPTANAKPLEEEASTSSFLEGLNPLNAFSTIWNSLPSLNIFGSSSELVDDESDFTDAGTSVDEYQQKSQQDSKYPPVQSVGGNGLFGGMPVPYKAELPFDISSIPNHPDNPFHYSFRRRRRSLSSAGSLRRNMPTRPRVLTFYKPLGQGSYQKYEILPEDDHKNEEGKERRRPSIQRPIPPRPLKKPVSPYGRPMRPLRNLSKGGKAQNREGAADATKTMDDLCPKYGSWRYDGEMCVSLTAIPTWGCKPKDLISTGKLAICRNKIFM